VERDARRTAGHEGFDLLEIVGIDGLLELPDLFEGFDVGLQLRPARESIETGNFELRIGKRISVTSFEQILGLIFQMAEIGTIGERKRRVLSMGQHSDLLSLPRPSSAHRAERRIAKFDFDQVGFYPFRGPDASLTLQES
jgi:hypothetical protein